MSEALIQVLLFTLAPVAAMAVGGAVAAFRPPGARLGSAVQHFAAGVVFAAVAVELLPDVVHRDAPVAAAVGFALGVTLMLGLRSLARRFEGDGEGGGGSLATVMIVGVDILIDGLLIGVAFAAGAREGVLIAVALAIELLSLGLATAAGLKRSGATRGRTLATVGGLALLPLVGSTLGVLVHGGLGDPWMEAIVAFAAAALLYLVTEDLLVEAHAVPEAPWAAGESAGTSTRTPRGRATRGPCDRSQRGGEPTKDQMIV